MAIAMMKNLEQYRVKCTLTFGDIYGQIIIWLGVIFISLAAAVALMGANRPLYGFATVALILVLSLPFLLFAFVTTLLNHIEVTAVEPETSQAKTTTATMSGQQSLQTS